MRASLICQEGPGAGQAYSLDPTRQPVLSVGRSSECDVVLVDHRASRHHADLSWNGQEWEIRDRSSTNGTYVNGMRVHQPYELRLGDRVTIGETTMVLREAPNQARSAENAARQVVRTVERPVVSAPGRAAPGAGPQAAPRAAAGAVYAFQGARLPFWIVQILATLAVVCLAAGAFLPWFEITGSVSSDLQPMFQGLANLVASLSGQDSIFNLSMRVDGMQGYGRLTLAIAIVSTIALAVDIFFYRKSAVPGLVYLVSGAVATAAVGFDILNYMQNLERLRDLTVLFGIQLVDVVEFITQYIEFDIRLLNGLYLTGAGLLLLLLAGLGRILVAILGRERQAE
jgi:pSer/pThr/pTyr-binding forkhead associated (FHA) protein